MNPLMKKLYLYEPKVLSEKEFSDIKYIITKLPELNALAQKKAALLQEMNQSIHSEEQLILPQEINSIDKKNESGITPLISMVSFDQKEVVQLMIEAKANPNIQDLEGDTALICSKLPDITHMLIEAKANLNLQNIEGNTALIYAAKYNYVETVRILIEAKANLDMQNNEGDTALIAALKQNFTEIIRILIEAKADLNIQNKKGNVALTYAAKTDDMKVMQLLIEERAYLNLRNNAGDTVFSGIMNRTNLPALNYLLRQGAIDDTDKLLEFLLEQDQRDPEVWDAIWWLYQKQKEYRAKDCKEINDFEKLDEEEYEELEKYVEKLSYLIKFRICVDEDREQMFNNIDESIDHTKNTMPKELINMMVEYSYPPLSGLSFFEAKDIEMHFANNFLTYNKKKMQEKNYEPGCDFIMKPK